jgi:hypothetical protein
MNEEWKDIKGYEGLYQVSNLGRVKSLDRVSNGQPKRGQILKPFKSSFRYLAVEVSRNAVTKSVPVHRLVAQAFLPNPDNLPQINHKDGIKENNHVNNLEFCTAKHNSKHAVSSGLRVAAKGERCACSKLKEGEVREIRSLYSRGVPKEEIAKIFKITRENIRFIVNRITWKHI